MYQNICFSGCESMEAISCDGDHFSIYTLNSMFLNSTNLNQYLMINSGMYFIAILLYLNSLQLGGRLILP